MSFHPKQVECCGTCAYISNNCIKGTHPKGHAINVNIFDAPCKDYISCKNRESIPAVEPSLPKFQVGQKVVTKNGHLYTVEQVTKGTCDNNFWYVIIDGDPLSRDCVTEADLISNEEKKPACEKEIIFTGIYAEAFDLLCNKPNKIADMLAQAKTEPSIEQRLAEIERKINILFKV